MARTASAIVMQMSQIILLVVALDQMYSQLGYACSASSSL